MKKYILFLAVACLSSCMLQKHTVKLKKGVPFSEKYKALEKFKGDTLQYLEENFIKNKVVYVDQSLSTIIHDLEIESPYCNFNPSAYPTGYYTAINIYFIDNTRTKYSKMKDKTTIYIKFKNPVEQNKIELITKQFGRGITDELINCLKETKIEDIKIYQYNTN